MTHSIDPIHFEALAELDPEAVCRRALCEYDDARRCYTLSVWGEQYAVFPHESTIHRMGRKLPNPHEYLYLFIIHYLLKAKETELCNEWISEKDVPGGTAFFRGPHEIPTRRIASAYGGDIEGFINVSEQSGGTPLDMADAAYMFRITPRIPAAVLFWDKDDEFPAESRILFDKSIIRHLALDILFALAVDICTRIGSAKAFFRPAGNVTEALNDP